MLTVIGIGPGSEAMMTEEAVTALKEAEVVVGYKTYTHLVKPLVGDKEVIKTGMRKEIERCHLAIELAQEGKNVAMVCSGDAGIYGMAGLSSKSSPKRSAIFRCVWCRYYRQYRRRVFTGCPADARLLPYQPERPAHAVGGD